MEKCIINKRSLKNFRNVKNAQKTAGKFYGEKLFDFSKNIPAAKIPKFVDVTEIGFIDLTQKNSCTPVEIDSKEKLIEILRKNKITGRSGNGFETARKIENFLAKDGLLLVNGVECDPGLIHDSWIYRMKLDEVAEGISLLQKIFGFRKSVLATKEKIQKEFSFFEQKKIKPRFPAGYEKTLVKNIFGINLGKKNPAEEGILVLNIQTVLAISELSRGENSGRTKFLTVADLETAKGFVVKAELGMQIKDIAAKTGISCSEENLYAGTGAFNCHGISCGEIAGDTTGFIARGKMPDYKKAGHCVGCGRCSKNCPAKVDVKGIVHNAKKAAENPEILKKFNAENCIGCGACTYFCVAGKDLRSIVARTKKH